MSSDLTHAVRSPSQFSRCNAVEIARANLAILENLEVSLQASQKALLARDLESIEFGIREQMRLLRAFELAQAAQAKLADSLAAGSSRPSGPVSLAEELTSERKNVLHLARVQAALLARAERSIKMIANLLAGPAAIYGPPHNAHVDASASRCDQAKEHRCRA
jgi:hypothetical protein